MQQNPFHNVSDLSADARSTIEAIVGHPLHQGDVLYIATLSPGSQSSTNERNTAWDELESMISQIHQHAARRGFLPNGIDEIIDSECAAVRYGSDAASK